MRYADTRYHARRHPVLAFLVLLIFSPYLLAALALTAVCWVLVFILTLGRNGT